MPNFIVPKYAKGFDAQRRFDLKTLVGLRSLGHRYAAHYINGKVKENIPGNKAIVKSQFDTVLGAGLGIILIFEKGETRGVTSNLRQAAENGRIDAAQAIQDTSILGYPSEAQIILAVGDTDTNSSNIESMVTYWNSFEASVPNPVGLYGDYDLIDFYKNNLSVSSFFQANAWGFSRGRLHPATSVLQKMPMDNRDGNIVLKPITAWHPDNLSFPTDPYSNKYSIFAPSQGYWGNYPLLLKKPDVKLGVRGQIVQYVQGVLRIYVDPKLPITGYCGNLTVEAIRKFQYIYSNRVKDGRLGPLKVDGWCGHATFSALDSVAMGMVSPSW